MMTASRLIMLVAVCAAMCVALPTRTRVKRQAVDFEPDIVLLEESMPQVSCTALAQYTVYFVQMPDVPSTYDIIDTSDNLHFARIRMFLLT
jgi:hypothetical protein